MASTAAVTLDTLSETTVRGERSIFDSQYLRTLYPGFTIYLDMVRAEDMSTENTEF